MGQIAIENKEEAKKAKEEFKKGLYEGDTVKHAPPGQVFNTNLPASLAKHRSKLEVGTVVNKGIIFENQSDQLRFFPIKHLKEANDNLLQGLRMQCKKDKAGKIVRDMIKEILKARMEKSKTEEEQKKKKEEAQRTEEKSKKKEEPQSKKRKYTKSRK